MIPKYSKNTFEIFSKFISRMIIAKVFSLGFCSFSLIKPIPYFRFALPNTPSIGTLCFSSSRASSKIALCTALSFGGLPTGGGQLNGSHDPYSIENSPLYDISYLREWTEYNTQTVSYRS